MQSRGLFFTQPLRMDLSYLPQPEEVQKTMSYSPGQTKASLPMVLQASLGGLGTWKAGPWCQSCVSLCKAQFLLGPHAPLQKISALTAAGLLTKRSHRSPFPSLQFHQGGRGASPGPLDL